MEKLMNEENEWDHGISAEVKEGPADCIRIGEVVAALNKSSAVPEMGDRGHKQTWAEKSGAAVPFFLGDLVPIEHKVAWPTHTSIPSSILVHPAIWPQRTLAENWGCAL